MTLEDINKKLADIAKALDEIAWDKEMKEADKTKIESDVNSVDTIMVNENEFGKEQLDSYTKSVQAATEKGKDFLKDRDISKESSSQYKSNNRKAELVKNLSGKYDDLFKKQQAIEKIEKSYNTKDLRKYAKDKMESNESLIEDNNKLENNLSKFSKNVTVKEALTKIAETTKKINEFKDLETEIRNLTDKINERESEVATPGIDPILENKLKNEISNFKKQREDLARKKGITYDENTILSVIQAKIDHLKNDNNENRNKIIQELGNSKKSVKDALGDLNNIEPEDISKHIEGKILATQTEKIALRHENDRLKSNMKQMRKDLPLGEVADINSSYKPFNYEPSNDEIVNSDVYKNAMNTGLPVATSRRDIIAKRMNFILNRQQPDGKRHPIAWLRAQFGGKKLDNLILESNARNLARDEIIKAKQQEARDIEDAQQKDYVEAVERNAFRRSIYNKQAARAILEGRETTAEAEAMNDFVERNSAEPEK